MIESSAILSKSLLIHKLCQLQIRYPPISLVNLSEIFTVSSFSSSYTTLMTFSFSFSVHRQLHHASSSLQFFYVISILFASLQSYCPSQVAYPTSLIIGFLRLPSIEIFDREEISVRTRVRWRHGFCIVIRDDDPVQEVLSHVTFLLITFICQQIKKVNSYTWYQYEVISLTRSILTSRRRWQRNKRRTRNNTAETRSTYSELDPHGRYQDRSFENTSVSTKSQIWRTGQGLFKGPVSAFTYTLDQDWNHQYTYLKRRCALWQM